MLHLGLRFQSRRNGSISDGPLVLITISRVSLEVINFKMWSHLWKPVMTGRLAKHKSLKIFLSLSANCECSCMQVLEVSIPSNHTNTTLTFSKRSLRGRWLWYSTWKIQQDKFQKSSSYATCSTVQQQAYMTTSIIRIPSTLIMCLRCAHNIPRQMLLL